MSCDNWMNINLREVICTSRVSTILQYNKQYIYVAIIFRIFDFLLQDGDKFWRMPECYIRGSTIKYLRIPDEVIDMVKEETMVKGQRRGDMKGGRGGNQRGRGGGRGSFGGGRGGKPAPLGRGVNQGGGNVQRNLQSKQKLK